MQTIIIFFKLRLLLTSHFNFLPIIPDLKLGAIACAPLGLINNNPMLILPSQSLSANRWSQVERSWGESEQQAIGFYTIILVP